MTPPSAQSVLAALALAILGALGGVLAFVAVPQSNQQLMATVVGALAGALTVGAGTRLTDTFNPPKE